MIDLNDLRIFERVAVRRSFSAAAQTLEMPKSRVSRSVTRLEAALSVRLLQRNTREVRLTEPGEALLQRFRPLLSGIDETIDYVGSLAKAPHGTLRVATVPVFGIDALAGLLPSFLQLHPGVIIHLNLFNMLPDLISDHVDVAINFGPLPDTDVVARRIGTLNQCLGAAPHYLDRCGRPDHPRDLVDHDLVDLLAPVKKPAPMTLTRGDESITITRPARVTTDCALNLYHLVLAGAGYGPCPAHRCEADIAAGRLVRLLPHWSLPPHPVHALFPSRRQVAPAVRAFIDFLVDYRRTQAW